MSTVERTYCRICEAACGLLATKGPDGRVEKLRPDRDHPLSQGFICAKGMRFLEVNRHPERLLHPMKRGADGELRRIGWDAAIREAGGRLRQVIDRHGPHAVGIYFGNPMAFNALGTVGMLAFMYALRSRNVYSAGSQDCNNKFSGSRIVHGAPVIQPVPDLEKTDLAVMFGTNPTVSQSSFVHLPGGSLVFDRIRERGGEVIWIDPRRTESAERGGQHLAVRPTSDVYLMLALLDGLRDRYRPDHRIEGMDRLLALAGDYPIPRAAELTGLAAADIEGLLRRIRDAPRAAFHMSVGVNQGPFGTLSYVALHALSYLSGNFDREGGMLVSPIGVMLGEAWRRRANSRRPVRSRIGDHPAVLDTMPGGILADEILTPGAEQIRALIVVAGDPLLSIPGAPRLEQALPELETIIGIDMFENATLEHAHLLLPVKSFLERWDMSTTSLGLQTAGVLQTAGPVEPSPGECRGELEILADLSLAMGRPMFGKRTARLGRFDWGRLLTGAQAGLRAVLGRLWPAIDHGIPMVKPRPGRYLGWGPRTPDRRLRFWHADLEPEPARLHEHAARLESVAGGGGYLLIGRRRRIGHNSWLHGGNRDSQPAVRAWMCPADLDRLGVSEGDAVRLRCNGVQVELPVAGREGVAQGTVVVPHGLPEVNVNTLLPAGSANCEPLSGTLWMTGVPIHVERAGEPAGEPAPERSR